MNRREFIYASGLLGGGLLLTFHTSASHHGVAKSATGTATLNNFISIKPDGEVGFQFVKHEMGQGVATAMAQILAEELCADWDKVKIEFPRADIKKYQNDQNGGYDTGGSCTIIYQWDLMRTAGATARQMLIESAAITWRTSPENCYAENHQVINRQTAQRIGFGALASLAATQPVPANVVLKNQERFELIGQPKPAKLIPDIVTGQLLYGIDVNISGMLYAVIARCPVFKGTLKSFDATHAWKIPGVKNIFSTKPIAGLQTQTPYMPHDIREGVAVVADSFWSAQKGREALIIEWDEGINANRSTADFERLAEQRATHRTDPTGYIGDENAVANLDHVRKTIRASYIFPHQLHACMEPLNCTAHAQPGSCEVWMGSQAPNLIVGEVQRVFGFAEENINVHLFPSGGGFGRRYYPDIAVEAVFLSKTAGNIPVKLLWTREDDHQCNLVHMFQYMEYQAALDKNNQLYAWYEKELRTYTWAAKYADPQLPAMPYAIPNIRLDLEDMIADELVHSSAWRGVIFHGRSLSECFIDELAADQKKDPYLFRLALLKEDRDVYVGDPTPISTSRMRAVLMLAAEKAGWGKQLEPGSGMGIAVCPYGGSYCAVVAEVIVKDHRVVINKITIGVDCGNVINPSGASNQLVGGVVWSLTALLYGGLPIENGRAKYSNFHQNRLLRMNDCPPMTVHFVETKEKRPGGVGEISSTLGVPAVLNAIFAATGKRIRKIPLRADDFTS